MKHTVKENTMRGKVTAARLNVRERPDPNAVRLGLLTQNTIVDILGTNDDWCEINYAGRLAFISQRYVQPLTQIAFLKGRVTANTLNIRNQPGTTGNVVGSLKRNSLIDIVADHDDWLEIRFNQDTAFVAARFVQLLDTAAATAGSVTASRLNVRDKPGSRGRIVGTLGLGSQIAIRNTVGNWHEIMFNGVPGYVSAKYVTTGISEEVGTPIAANENEPQAEEAAEDPASVALAPAELLDVTGNSKSRKVATTWNKYGNLLTVLSQRYNIEPACVIAVLCVESSGDGFRQDNENRMVIRFENHKFWSFWGKQHADVFNRYFKLNLASKPWLGHKWRPDPAQDWITFHGNQIREWQVLEFARNLDDTAALKSISMGAPQIMGFNYRQLDYPNVQAMFEDFSKSMRYQILGLFQFLSPAMISALRRLDFVSFAGHYNGSGQKQQYGQWINEHYLAFKQLAG
jgi:uncharacterized protein YgiM (DUF1202 family)